MRRLLSNESKNRRKLQLLSAIMIITGYLILYAVFQITSNSEKRNISQEADEVMEFLQSSCQKYDDYQLGNQVENLQNLQLKAENLCRYLNDIVLSSNDQLAQFEEDQSLTGIWILDADLNTEYYADRDQMERSNLLEQILSEDNAANVQQYPQKSYAERIVLDDSSYDYVIIAREDRDGVIICYEDVTADDEDMSEFSLNSLLSGDSFRNNAIIVITDGKQVLCSNAKEQVGRMMEKCPAVDIEDGEASDSDHGMFQMTSNGDNWYGKHDIYREYYLYVFYKDSDVFSDRQLVVVMTLALYIFGCLSLTILAQYIRRTKMKRKEKEYHLINVIASIYSANLALYPEENIWKPIVMSKRLEKVISHITQADRMLDTFNRERVAPAYQEAFGEFLKLKDLEERLGDRRFIGYTFEDVEGLWYQALLIPQKFEQDDHKQIVMLVIRDVSEQKRKEMTYQEDLRVTAEEAERANAVKTDFLKRMSHDMRTPINGIRGLANVGKNHIHDVDKIEECLDEIMRSSDMLVDLVNNVLNMSKLESGGIQLTEEAFDLQEMLDDVKRFVNVQAERKQISLQINSAEVEHYHLIGSPLHIRQIFQNIIENAVKFNMDSGSVNVVCREFVSDENTVELEMVCADTGIGMSEEFQKHVFEAFTQEDTSARTTYSGIGLGLAITKKLVNCMNGEVSFESERGIGTVFTVKLPVQIDRAYYQLSEKKDPLQVMKGLQILLVEDNELNMEITEYMLTEQGAVVTEAWNGKEAADIYESCESGTFDVILMDIMMPVMNGLEAARCIRASEKEDAQSIPIIALSANAFDDDIAQSLAAGMNMHLAKPLEFQKVIEAIAALVVQ
ncbi:ATP-binding protein [Dorea sp. AF36-15AT]|uniref:ATP-binding protein n=1 Tax=Dorea sp. AF36-15AT TaxID=2292041 RepID=UPI000E50F29E|nr:ATP-binding protein [Dorea sp. AF36-15AT]RHP07378.1 response regulator [Dorea sp. AF36-15AT]